MRMISVSMFYHVAIVRIFSIVLLVVDIVRFIHCNDWYGNIHDAAAVDAVDDGLESDGTCDERYKVKGNKGEVDLIEDAVTNFLLQVRLCRTQVAALIGARLPSARNHNGGFIRLSGFLS